MVVSLVIFTFALFFLVEGIVWVLNRTASTEKEEAPRAVLRPFDEIHLPRGLFVADNHAWVRLAESGEFRVGADEFLAEALGGADRVELPEVGTEVRRGDPLAKVWRHGRVLVLPAPVDGTVMQVNAQVAEHPEELAEDPYGNGWLAAVLPVEPTEALKDLRLGERARQWLSREVQRFVEFLARRSSPQLVGATIPDGARPVVGAALALDDDGWKEFRREFVER